MTPTDEHRHCRVCNRVCALGDETCSKKCAETLEDRNRTRRNYTLLLYGAIALLLVVFLSRLFV